MDVVASLHTVTNGFLLPRHLWSIRWYGRTIWKRMIAGYVLLSILQVSLFVRLIDH